MPTFAIVAEGLTDQLVLEQIIEQVLEAPFDGDVDVNFLQPLRDATDAHSAPHGGWELVLEYCQTRAADALATNDFLVVQIDTDCGDHEGYGLPLTVGGKDRAFNELVEGAGEILKHHIGDALYAENAGRICFAICVHTTESWLLLILFGQAATKNGLQRLNRARTKANQRPIAKTGRDYLEISNEIKAKRLLELAKLDTSLAIFLQRLQELAPEVGGAEVIRGAS
jgi:hypothetical protein